MGVDPNNITYDALFNRLVEIVLANITLTKSVWLGSCRYFAYADDGAAAGHEHGGLHVPLGQLTA